MVAVFESRGLFAYSMDGEALWHQDLGLLDEGPIYDPTFQWGPGSSPILYQDLVIAQVDRQKDSYIAAFSAKDGVRRWKMARDEPPSWGTPTVCLASGPERRAELVTNGTNEVRAYDPLTGSERWHLKTGNSMITVATPIFGLGLVLLTPA